MKQTKFSEPDISDRTPKGHRIHHKKQYMKEYPVNDKTYEGIMKEAENLGYDTFIVGYSGGKDSGKVLDKLIKMGKCDGVLHLRTNTGVSMTEDFVINQCKEMGVKLYIREPTPLSFAYVAYCLQFGFPGPNMHSAIMKILKYNTMVKFVQEPEFKDKKVALVAGVRKWESVRRMGNYNEPISDDSGLTFINPIFYEKDDEVYKYFIENGLKRSPSYETLGFSGECMCGAFAQKDEALLLKQVDPKRFEFMEWITDGIKRFGSKNAQKYTKWGDTSDFDDVRNQEIMEKFFTPEQLENIDRMAVNTCGSECGMSTMKGMLDI
jgi:3'-phosphoadenosine 5'-phosphosulfate sulfotransferase (PAPS reductase)/FAD synthetase